MAAIRGEKRRAETAETGEEAKKPRARCKAKAKAKGKGKTTETDATTSGVPATASGGNSTGSMDGGAGEPAQDTAVEGDVPGDDKSKQKEPAQKQALDDIWKIKD